MSNPQKRRQVYRQLVHNLDDISRENSVEGLEKTLLKTHHLLLNENDFSDESGPESDFAGKLLEDLTRYYELKRNRQKKIIGEGEREITTEDEAYESLILTENITRNLILPHFERSNDFSNSVFNDMHNLGLAYLHAIVSAVADGYIPTEEALNSKLDSVDVVKGVIRFWDEYKDSREIRRERGLRKSGKIFSKLLGKTRPKYMRSFELVPTTQKNINNEGEITKKIRKQVTEEGKDGLIFKPTVIFPIAQGGNEFGIRLAMKYEDKGHFPITYPLLYSRKTRHHKFPWISNDEEFLGRSLQGEDFLIAEDWVTTGNTLRGILLQLENLYPHDIKIATLKRDKKRSMVPFLDNYEFYVGEWGVYQGDKIDL